MTRKKWEVRCTFPDCRATTGLVHFLPEGWEHLGGHWPEGWYCPKCVALIEQFEEEEVAP